MWTIWRDVDRDRKQGRGRGSENRADRPTCRYFELRIKKKNVLRLLVVMIWYCMGHGYGLGHLVFLGL